MSAAQRTPKYFPRMKVRGARRRRMAPFQRAAGALARMAVTAQVASRNMADLVKILEARS